MTVWPHTTWTIKGRADKIYPWYQSHTKLGSRSLGKFHLQGHVILKISFQIELYSWRGFIFFLLKKFRDKIRKVFFMPHPCMYFGEYLCICIMTDVGHQTCHLHLPWSTIFWSFWHNINSQSDQTKKCM